MSRKVAEISQPDVTNTTILSKDVTMVHDWHKIFQRIGIP
jgi:hypothetical protein